MSPGLIHSRGRLQQCPPVGCYNMRYLLTILITFIAALPKSETELSLHVRILPELSASFRDRQIRVVLQSRNFQLDTVLGKDNSLHLKSVPIGNITILFYSYIICRDSITKKYFRVFENINLQHNKRTVCSSDFPLDCPNNKYIEGKICPKCHKSDQIIPIIYGLPDPTSLKGEVGVDYSLGGCITTGCDPDWFCKRDWTEF